MDKRTIKMIELTKREIDFITELISKHCHKDNKYDWKLGIELVKKLYLYNFKVNVFQDWLKKQNLKEVVTKEYKWREIVLDEEFVLAKFNEDTQS